ncbi:MAG: hypothetical protein GW772_13670 [Flavobacteriia bacterium]|nr:hypothetical protein [Flavobacteriia bacterium]PIV95356.1 MAG: hypothetical protein COW43_13930 [Flavobacteriaceae bacterium CG17_big_fil_post_rev_8_21_14_2_50_31_13]PIX13440.1 MAG: hypothetical protein COZ74_06290 [Flavobacteriaceae bacterium CG_4_8_14_3_um_filter_31_8]
MKKIVLTSILSFCFFLSFGNEIDIKKQENEFFNCWVKITYLTVNPETFETTSFEWYHWAGYAGSQESCNKLAKEFADSINAYEN